MSTIVDMLKNHMWVISAAGILLITALAHVITRSIYNRLFKKAEEGSSTYRKAILKALKSPSTLFIWLLGLSIFVSIILSHISNPFWHYYIAQGKSLVIILALSWAAIRFIHNTESGYLHFCAQQCKEVDKTLVHALAQLSIIVTIAIAGISVLSVFGLPVSGLIAFGGIGGATLAFASKDLLANLFGGLVIYMDRPFKIGDWIRSPDKQIEGTVEHIGLRVTCIRTFDKRPLYVPNGFFLSISVENASRMLNRRINTNIGIRYQDADKMDKITQQVKQMLQEHPEIDNAQTMIVNFVEFSNSSLNFMVYTFTKTTDWIKFQEVQHDVFIKIINIIKDNSAECAFPTRTLHWHKETADIKTETSDMPSA